jgi:hypothetical protein
MNCPGEMARDLSAEGGRGIRHSVRGRQNARISDAAARLAGIHTPEETNRFLRAQDVGKMNRQFGVPAAQADDALDKLTTHLRTAELAQVLPPVHYAWNASGLCTGGSACVTYKGQPEATLH